jgi:hypothetical protein
MFCDNKLNVATAFRKGNRYPNQIGNSHHYHSSAADSSKRHNFILMFA